MKGPARPLRLDPASCRRGAQAWIAALCLALPGRAHPDGRPPDAVSMPTATSGMLPDGTTWRATQSQLVCRGRGGSYAAPLDHVCVPEYERIRLEARGEYVTGVGATLHLYFNDTAPAPQSGAQMPPAPGVLLMPLHYPTFMSWFCMDIARQGMACAMLTLDKEDTWEIYPETALASVARLTYNIRRGTKLGRVALEYLRQRQDVDPQRLGIVGVSLGGIMASLAAQEDARVKSLVLFFSGADLADNIMESEHKWLTDFRQNLIQQARLEDEAELRLWLQAALQDIDPRSGVERMGGMSVYMVNIGADPIFLPDITRRYAEAMANAGARVQATQVPLSEHNSMKALLDIRGILRSLGALRGSLGFLKDTLETR